MDVLEAQTAPAQTAQMALKRKDYRKRTPLLRYKITYGPEDEDIFTVTAPNGVKSDVIEISDDGVTLLVLDKKPLIVVTKLYEDEGDAPMEINTVYQLNALGTEVGQDDEMELPDELEGDDEDSEDAEDGDEGEDDE